MKKECAGIVALAERALALPVVLRRGGADAFLERLAAEQGEERKVADGVSTDSVLRVFLDRIENLVLEQALAVVCEERLQGLGAGLVLADVNRD